MKPKKNVLIVDDNRDFADTLSILVATMGHRPTVAYDTETGLKLAETITPDVIFHDIALPGRDGYSAAAELRSKPKSENTLLVAVTAYSTAHDRERAKQAGFDLHWCKPVVFDDLDELLNGPVG